MKRGRLLVAQGPSQLVSALAVWEYLAAHPGASLEAGDDILVLGGFCVPDKIARELERVCREIAPIWKFATIVSTRSWDAALQAGKMSFEQYLKKLAEAVGAIAVQEVYVCRNMQPLNEAALYAWPEAKKVCFGDIGLIGLNGLFWSKPMKESGYPQVDQIMTHAPVERTAGAFDQYPLTLVPLPFFMKAWTNASQAIGGLNALSRELSYNCGPKKILICPTNFTEGGNVLSVEEELQFHVACLAPYLEKDCTIFIKGHPRQTLNQAGLLTARLCSQGYDARCFPGFNAVPIDLFARNLQVDVLLTLYSYSGIVWRLSQPACHLVIGAPDSVVRKYIQPEALACYHYDELTALYYLLSIMSTRREYWPVRMQSVLKCLDLVPPSPILLPGRATDAPGELALDPVAVKFYESVMQAEARTSRTANVK